MSEGAVTAGPGAETLSRADIAKIGSSNQLGDVLALPEHLRDALWRVESAIMQDWDTTAGLVVAGIGGPAARGGRGGAGLRRGDVHARVLDPGRRAPPGAEPRPHGLCGHRLRRPAA